MYLGKVYRGSSKSGGIFRSLKNPKLIATIFNKYSNKGVKKSPVFIKNKTIPNREQIYKIPEKMRSIPLSASVKFPSKVKQAIPLRPGMTKAEVIKTMQQNGSNFNDMRTKKFINSFLLRYPHPNDLPIHRIYDVNKKRQWIAQNNFL